MSRKQSQMADLYSISLDIDRKLERMQYLHFLTRAEHKKVLDLSTDKLQQSK